jgi:hypothetical protein
MNECMNKSSFYLVNMPCFPKGNTQIACQWADQQTITIYHSELIQSRRQRREGSSEQGILSDLGCYCSTGKDLWSANGDEFLQ